MASISPSLRVSTGRVLFVVEDNRFDYGETRFVAIGNIGYTAYTMAFTPRGRNVRIISLRLASREERKRL
jgi:uncharacterized DUF497 family protein